jgi:hypothetical protein
MSGDYLGDVESRLGQRLVKLMDGGNEYVAAASAILEDGVRVFIRETFQSASQMGKLSFPPTVSESVRPYVKSRLVRGDRDDEPSYGGDDDADEWSPVDEDDEESADDGAIEIRQQARISDDGDIDE